MTVTIHSARPTGHRSVPLLEEPALDHYPEFAQFFTDRFGLDLDPLGRPAILAIDDRFYELVFIGRSGRPFPCGVEVSAVVAGLEPVDAAQADRDLVELIDWILDGVAGPWSSDAFHQAGRIFRVPTVPPE